MLISQTTWIEKSRDNFYDILYLLTKDMGAQNQAHELELQNFDYNHIFIFPKPVWIFTEKSYKMVCLIISIYKLAKIFYLILKLNYNILSVYKLPTL